LHGGETDQESGTPRLPRFAPSLTGNLLDHPTASTLTAHVFAEWLFGRHPFMTRPNTTPVSGANDETSATDELVFEKFIGVRRRITNIDDPSIRRQFGRTTKPKARFPRLPVSHLLSCLILVTYRTLMEDLICQSEYAPIFQDRQAIVADVPFTAAVSYLPEIIVKRLVSAVVQFRIVVKH
jgi:hypothetical protein